MGNGSVSLRNKLLLGVCLLSLPLSAQNAPEKHARVFVQHYNISAEIKPDTQSITAHVVVEYAILEDGTNSAIFELNNALNVTKVTDETGQTLQPTRTQTDFSVRVPINGSVSKGSKHALTFDYDGRLSGTEDSPIYGIKFAAIKQDFSYLLYPARWFPVSGYSTDRFTADLTIKAPADFTVVASGSGTGSNGEFTFHFTKNSFPGSIALVKGAPFKSNSEGIRTDLYFRGPEKEQAGPYGDTIARMINYFSGLYGQVGYSNLTVIETEDGAVSGYSAPGLMFLSPNTIGRDVNSRVLANQVSQQWWGVAISPTTRNHLWLTNGMAAYSEALWTEKDKGPAAAESMMKDVSTEALTIDNVPLIQSARMEDYSPEYWALTGSKGAEVFNMLRAVVGDENFYKSLKLFLKANYWNSVDTADLRKAAEEITHKDLKWFFIEWIESSGAPEFKLDYTVFRTAKGFRVVGKISQDMDTFRMPVDLRIETEGNPEDKQIEVAGTSSEFSVDTFGKPKSVTIDPAFRLLRLSPDERVAVAIRRGEQFAEISQFTDALKEYQKALETKAHSSLAHYRVAEVYFLQNNFQSAANEFRECLQGDLDPKWVEVWAHINIGKIFDITGQRDRAVNEYEQGRRTRDNTSGAQDEIAKYLRTPYERKKSEI
jgi:tetratricopeptide (TPR) repeat protein